MSLNTDLNIFLALLEDRPEGARAIMGSLPYRVEAGELSSVKGRIEQARENIKCQAVKQALRMVMNKCLELNRPEIVSVSHKDTYFLGVQDVENILGSVLQACEETEKKLGPPA